MIRRSPVVTTGQTRPRDPRRHADAGRLRSPLLHPFRSAAGACLAIWLVMPPEAAAQSLESELAACAQIVQGSARLACYDALVSRLGGTPGRTDGAGFAPAPVATFRGTETLNQETGSFQVDEPWQFRWAARGEFEVQALDARGIPVGDDVDSRRGGSGVSGTFPPGQFRFRIEDAEDEWVIEVVPSRLRP